MNKMHLSIEILAILIKTILMKTNHQSTAGMGNYFENWITSFLRATNSGTDSLLVWIQDLNSATLLPLYLAILGTIAAALSIN